MLNLKLLFFCLLLLKISFGQQNANISDCSKWITTTEDRMTGEKTTASKETILVSNDGGKTGFGIFWMDMNQGTANVEYVLSIQAVSKDAGSCVDRGSKINILFTDNTRIELWNEHAFNCDANVIVRFNKYYTDATHIEQLKTKKIAAMRVSLSRGYVEKDFTAENANMFLNQLNCLTQYSTPSLDNTKDIISPNNPIESNDKMLKVTCYAPIYQSLENTDKAGYIVGCKAKIIEDINDRYYYIESGGIKGYLDKTWVDKE